MPNFTALDDVVRDLSSVERLGNHAIPNGFAVIAYNVDGDCLYRHNTSVEFDYDSRNPMASCSKMVSPLVLLQMQEQGVIQMDQPVPDVPDMILDKVLVDYTDAPVFEPATAPTWTQLANHSSGLSYAFETTAQLFCRYLGVDWPPRAGDPKTYSKANRFLTKAFTDPKYRRPTLVPYCTSQDKSTVTVQVVLLIRTTRAHVPYRTWCRRLGPRASDGQRF